jgi:hypothetical protein
VAIEIVQFGLTQGEEHDWREMRINGFQDFGSNGQNLE